MELNKILRMADALYGTPEFDKFCEVFDAYIKKHAHYAPMQGPGDYDFANEYENLPWSGSMKSFMSKFPGGLPEWNAYREALKRKHFRVENGVMENTNEPIYSKAHYGPKEDDNLPNPWRKNMDYGASYDQSPYYGSIKEFMKKFPGGIKQWREWREKTKKKRNRMWSHEKSKKHKAQLEAIIKEAKKQKHDGAMIALMAPKEVKKALKGFIDKDTVSSDDLHLTLLYLGKAKDLNKTQVEAIKKAIEKVCFRHQPLSMRISGAGMFGPGDEDGKPVYVVPNAKGLSALQAELEHIIGTIVDLPSKHGWVPHMTLGYCKENPEVPLLKEFPEWTADKVRFQIRGEKVGDFALGNRQQKRKAQLQAILKKAETFKADDDNLREQLADLEHKQWAHWTKYMLNNLTDENKENWKRQIDTDYKDLSEKEKDSDREWADKVLKTVNKKASAADPYDRIADNIVAQYLEELEFGENYNTDALKKAIIKNLKERAEAPSTTPESDFEMEIEPKPGDEDRPTEMSGIINKAHYEPVGGDDVDEFEDEPHLFSNEGFKKFKSVREFLDKYREHTGQSADDAVSDFITYWKLLRKSKKRRK